MTSKIFIITKEQKAKNNLNIELNDIKAAFKIIKKGTL